MTLQALLALLSGGVVGIMLGATGAGGSILAVPLLVYIVGVPVQNAMAMSLIVVGMTASFGAWKESRHGKVRGLAAVVFSVTGLVGAWLGALGHHWASEETVLLLFGLLMIGVSVRTWKAGLTLAGNTHGHGCAQQFSLTCLAKALGIGFVVGLMTGFFGVGGGFLIMPALTWLLGFPAQIAIGTSLLIIAANAASGLAGHLTISRLDVGLTLWLMAGGVPGLIAGAKVRVVLGEQGLTRLFSAVSGAIGILLLIENSRHLLLP